MKEQLKWNEPWIMQRADPYIYRHTDGCYYFTASVPAYDRIILRRADSLAGLAGAVENTCLLYTSRIILREKDIRKREWNRASGCPYFHKIY